jgi:phosphoenolpyruvate synthase/pyruvate phosphate dikinase
VAQADAAMAVLIQEQLKSEYSFVLHTRDPIGNDHDLLYAELAAGLGETLASGTRGTPWRLAVNKSTGPKTCAARAAWHPARILPTLVSCSLRMGSWTECRGDLFVWLW